MRWTKILGFDPIMAPQEGCWIPKKDLDLKKYRVRLFTYLCGSQVMEPLPETCDPLCINPYHRERRPYDVEKRGEKTVHRPKYTGHLVDFKGRLVPYIQVAFHEYKECVFIDAPKQKIRDFLLEKNWPVTCNADTDFCVNPAHRGVELRTPKLKGFKPVSITRIVKEFAKSYGMEVQDFIEQWLELPWGTKPEDIPIEWIMEKTSTTDEEIKSLLKKEKGI